MTPRIAGIAAPLLALPGLAKARPRHAPHARGAIVAQRDTRLWSIREAWIARLLYEADIFSEGSIRQEPSSAGGGHDLVYYGSTSLRCPLQAVRAPLGVVGPSELGQTLLADPQLRLVAVRIARREACARAGGALNVMYAEIGARITHSHGSVWLAIDVDVSAALARVHAGLASE